MNVRNGSGGASWLAASPSADSDNPQWRCDPLAESFPVRAISFAAATSPFNTVAALSKGGSLLVLLDSVAAQTSSVPPWLGGKRISFVSQ